MDYADKSWLRKHRRPLWQLRVRVFHSRIARGQPGGDALHRGVQIRIENGLRYIVPTPANHR